MPEFVLDTSGYVYAPTTYTQGEYAQWPVRTSSMGARMGWGDLDALTPGYIEAMFFTADQPGVEAWAGGDGSEFEKVVGECGFSDLAPETLARIMADCAKFQETHAWLQMREGLDDPNDAPVTPDDTQAGRDFWYTRNGHGVGFWDGDWPEPYATALTEACEAFGECEPYLGDDGKVYLA